MATKYVDQCLLVAYLMGLLFALPIIHKQIHTNAIYKRAFYMLWTLTMLTSFIKHRRWKRWENTSRRLFTNEATIRENRKMCLPTYDYRKGIRNGNNVTWLRRTIHRNSDIFRPHIAQHRAYLYHLIPCYRLPSSHYSTALWQGNEDLCSIWVEYHWTLFKFFGLFTSFLLTFHAALIHCIIDRR